VDAIFDYYEKRRFEPSSREREILLNLQAGALGENATVRFAGTGVSG
jgi:hypothetical protein